MPSQIPDGSTRGWIIPIGGGEEKENDPKILQRFVELCGGADADIVVLPTASRLADTGARYERIFAGLGAGRVESVDFASRQDCEDPDRLRRLNEATGIFFTGGNQLSLSTALGGTPVARLLRVRNAQGVHVAGTDFDLERYRHIMGVNLDGVVFGADESYLCAGMQTAASGPVSDYTRQQIFYRSIQHDGPDHDSADPRVGPGHGAQGQPGALELRHQVEPADADHQHVVNLLENNATANTQLALAA